MTHQSRVVTRSVPRPHEAVYDFLSVPENYPRWSEFFTAMRQEGSDWIATTPGGDVRVHFGPRNSLGVLDHTVTPTAGDPVYVPLRVIKNAAGSDVQFTVFRASGVSDDAFDADVAMVEKDLDNLARLLAAFIAQ